MKRIFFDDDSLKELSRDELRAATFMHSKSQVFDSESDPDSGTGSNTGSGSGDSGSSGSNSGSVSEGVEYDNTTGKCYATRVCLDGINTPSVSCSGTGNDCHLTSVDIYGKYYPIGVRCNDHEEFCDRITLPSGFDEVTSDPQEACATKGPLERCHYMNGIDLISGRCVGAISTSGAGKLYCDPVRER